jgi:hypothetical protein
MAMSKNRPLPLKVALKIEARRERQRLEAERAVAGRRSAATVKQLRLLRDLRDDLGLPLTGLGSVSMMEANFEIRGLLRRRDQRRAAENRRRRGAGQMTLIIRE